MKKSGRKSLAPAVVFPEGEIYHCKCEDLMRSLPKGSVDLVFGSPPYEDRRSYGEVEFNLEGEDWVDWMFQVFTLSLRACKGLVSYVVGHGKHGPSDWSAVPALLAADLHRAGVKLRNPAIYYRVGICGSGGPDWLRADYEWIICAANQKRLPWHNNKATGRKPKYKQGGAMTHRLPDGTRVFKKKRVSDYKDGDQWYREVGRRELDVANPGNVVFCTAGGGRMGSKVAHDNEAPFPEELARFAVLSFCPPGGTVLDPFGGSGTTLAAAVKNGRRFITCDVRESQVELMRKRYNVAMNTRGFGV